MSYSKQTWYDNESGGTPITAEKLNHMEQGIYDNAEAWDSISQVYVLFNTDEPIKTTAALPGTENAGDYDLVEVVYAYDLEGGKPIQNSCKINPKLPNGGFNLIAAGRSGNTFQIAQRIIGFGVGGISLDAYEYFVNFGSSTGSVAYNRTNSDFHIGVVAVLGYRNVLNFTSQ